MSRRSRRLFMVLVLLLVTFAMQACTTREVQPDPNPPMASTSATAPATKAALRPANDQGQVVAPAQETTLLDKSTPVKPTPEAAPPTTTSAHEAAPTSESANEASKHSAPRPWLQRETAKFITYGPEASLKEGDDDHTQVLFVHVPAAVTDTLHVRVFDGDIGGDHDTILGRPDTSTRFALFGGAGAASAPTVQDVHPTAEALSAGTLIASNTFAQDPALDNAWYPVAAFTATQGEEIQGEYVFKLVVQGVSGNDGNVFDVAISLSAARNVQPPGLRVLHGAPTIRLADPDKAAQMRFRIPPAATAITVHNFDIAGARTTLETAYRSVPIASSGQGVLRSTKVTLNPSDVGQDAAVLFYGGGRDSPNDAVFYVTDGAGRPLPIELPIVIGWPNRRPVVQVIHRALNDCRSVSFDARHTSDPDGDLLSFNWVFGNGHTATGSNVVHQYSEPGSYNAHVTVRDSSGWVGSTVRQSVPILVNSPPVAASGPDIIAAPGEPIVFDGSASTDPDGSIDEFSWDFGDGQKGQGSRATHSYKEPGAYAVTLLVKDDSGAPCNWGVDTARIRINAAPTAVTGPNVRGAAGATITLDGSKSFDPDGTITRYTWELGDSSRQDGARVTHTYHTPGTYTVRLTITDDSGARNGVATDTMTVRINHPPVAKAGADRHVAVGQPIEFDASLSNDPDGRIVDYAWDFGDGGVANGQRVSYAFDQPGTYTVTLRVRDDLPGTAGVAQDTVQVRVNAPPMAKASDDQLVTTSEVRFDATQSTDPDGTIRLYLWHFGDGTQGEGKTPVHVYEKPGVYTASVTVTDDSQTSWNQSKDLMTVVVNQRPTADAGPDPAPLAPGETVTLSAAESSDADGEIIAYTWELGDGARAEGPSVAHIYEKPGTYRVRLTIQDNTEALQAIDVDEITVRVNAKPVADAGPDIKAAPGDRITLNGRNSFDTDGAIVSYAWQFSNEQSAASSATTTRQFTKPGLYTAVLTVSDDSQASNSSAQDEVSIHINHQPRAIPGKDIFTCDTAISFDGSASADPDGDPLTYHWHFGDGSSSMGRVVSHVYAQGGVYPVTLMVDDGTGLANARHSHALTVTINRPPGADAGEDLTACAGKVSLFDGTGSTDPEGGFLKYRWDFGDGTSADVVNPTKIYTVGGLYEATLSVEDESGLQCNQDMDRMTVRVVESPVADAGGDRTVCAYTRVRFDGTGSRDPDGLVNRFLWDFGDGVIRSGATPEHIFTKSGTYHVLLTITGNQIGECANIDTDEVKVVVHDAPVARIVGPDAVAVGATMHLDGSQSTAYGAKIVAWSWDFGDGTSAEGQQVSHTFERHGTFIVTLSITTDADTDCRTVKTQKVVTANQAPVARGGEDRTVGVNEPVAFTAAASSDADGAITAYEWDFGDGQTASGVQVWHRYRKSGRYQAVLRVRDNTGVTNNQHVDTIEVTVNDAPVPHVDAPEFTCAGDDTAFSASRSTDADGDIIDYRWDFGDGQRATGVDVSHTWQEPGRYPVTLSVHDNTTVNNSLQQLTKIVNVNQPPFALAGPDRIVCAGQPVVFDGTSSTDPDGQLVRYQWTFGDDQQVPGPQVKHTYAAPGTYPVSLTVTDNSGTACGVRTDTAQARVNTPPVAQAGPDMEGFTGGAHDALFFDASRSYDPDRDGLSFVWDFGDGTQKHNAKVYHTYRQPGQYTVRLMVQDGTGLPCGEASDVLQVVIRARSAAR